MTKEADISTSHVWYESLGDPTSNSYRVQGILDETFVLQAIEDPSTVVTELSGKEVPVLVPMQYSRGAGYDVGRSYQLAGPDANADNTFYFSLPEDEELVKTNEAGITINSGYVFFDHADVDLQRAQNLITYLERSGFKAFEIPMLDEQAAPGNEQASITLYGFHTPDAEPENHKSIAKLARTFNTSYPNENRFIQGPALVSGTEIEAELIEKLWKIYEDRFQWLGECHPISMEDAKEEFVHLITSPETVSSIFFEEGEPKCFAYFTDNLEKLPWLDKTFLENPKNGKEPYENMLFWPGIVARADNTLNYAEPVIQLVTDAIYQQRAPFFIVFENTNRSEVYIPGLVHRYVNGASAPIKMPELISKQVYRCLRIAKDQVRA